MVAGLLRAEYIESCLHELVCGVDMVGIGNKRERGGLQGASANKSLFKGLHCPKQLQKIIFEI